MKHGTTPLDFLSHLVDKARGAVSAIEPRLPSLFEPIAGTDVTTAADAREQTDQAVARAETTAEPEPTPRPNHRGHGPRREGETPIAVAALLPARAAAAMSANEVPRREPSARDEADPMPAAQRERNDGAIVRAIGRNTLHAQPALVAANTPVAKQIEADVLQPRESAQEQSAQERHEKPSHLGALLPAPAAALISRPGVAVEAKSPPTSRADAPLGDLSQKQPAPVINVTIGRVEVRAVPASSGGPRAEPSKPKPLSLDDYLKQRRGNR